MIDIKFLRENPDIVKENIKKKFQDHKLVLVDVVIELDTKNREVKLFLLFNGRYCKTSFCCIKLCKRLYDKQRFHILYTTLYDSF